MMLCAANASWYLDQEGMVSGIGTGIDSQGALSPDDRNGGT